MLTHDPKFDVPLLEVALRLADDVRPGYIGAMGSRRTHESGWSGCVEAGLTDAELDLLSSPIGLDLGARTPGGDGRVHRRGDRRPPVGRVGRAAGVDRRAASTTTTDGRRRGPPREFARRGHASSTVVRMFSLTALPPRPRPH